MKFTTLSLAAILALAVSMPASAQTGQARPTSQTKTYYGFQTGIRYAPPAPRVMYTVMPRWTTVPRTGVRILNEQDPGYDMFRYGSWYYVSNNGYWYRAHSYRGPFTAVDARSVPRQLYSVPAKHWRHRPGGAPGQMNQGQGNGRGQGQDRGGH